MAVGIVNDEMYVLGGTVPSGLQAIAVNEQYTPVRYGNVESQAFPTLPFIVLGAVAIAVAVGAAIYLKKNRKK